MVLCSGLVRPALGPGKQFCQSGSDPSDDGTVGLSVMSECGMSRACMRLFHGLDLSCVTR